MFNQQLRDYEISTDYIKLDTKSTSWYQGDQQVMKNRPVIWPVMRALSLFVFWEVLTIVDRSTKESIFDAKTQEHSLKSGTVKDFHFSKSRKQINWKISKISK